MANRVFLPADILIPKNCDMTKWSVVACDQYTSQPEYWKATADIVGDAPSTLNLVLPEVMLESDGLDSLIETINKNMRDYEENGIFQEFKNAMIYVERTQSDGRLRKGLIGMIDLEAYDYTPGSGSAVRATEGTVLSRIPPRVQVRKDASLELPHVMLLTDDPDKKVIEPLSNEKSSMECIYDFDMMQNGGHIKGYILNNAQIDRVLCALDSLSDVSKYQEKYGTLDTQVLQFAVGDGNHSLATAKTCYEEHKKNDSNAFNSPCRYALVELVNLYDTALEFEPIHRVITNTDPTNMLDKFMQYYPSAYYGKGEGHTIQYFYGCKSGFITIPDPHAQLAVGTLQTFLDEYLSKNAGSIDYVHEDTVAIDLSRQENSIAFLLPSMSKDMLFPTVVLDGVLPRKTFSMGHAHDKRFYLESRKIR